MKLKCKVAFLAYVLACLFIAQASLAHVIGVDLGSEYIKVAGPHGDKGVDIVLNEQSRRKTDNFIGFRRSDLYIGDTAKSLAARFPLCTASAVNQLVRIRKDSSLLPFFRDLQYEYHVSFNNHGSATVSICDTKDPFTAEELYSMVLSYCKTTAVKDDVVDPKGVVVTIPFRTSPAERRAILDAARLSGLSVLGLMHSTTAAAFYYGVRHRGFGNNTLRVVVFDLGSTHTEVGVYEFLPAAQKAPLSSAFGTLRTLGVVEDRSLGGRAFDLCVARVIEAEARAKLSIGPVLGGTTSAQLKSQFSLLRAANKVRETLSVNSNTPYTVEGIAPDRDYHSSMTRATFEAECASLFQRVKDLATSVTKVVNISFKDLNSFEMMGGLSRTPKIIADLSEAIGRDVDRTMNMDEAAAIGAGYYAAKLSPLYRAKSLKLDETIPYGVDFEVEPPLSKEKPAVKRPLFGADGFLLGDSVSLTFNRTEDFSLNFYIGDDAARPFVRVTVTGVKQALTDMKALSPAVEHANNSHMVRLQIVLNETGLVQVEHAEVVVRYAEEVTQKVTENVTDKASGERKSVEKSVKVIKMRIRAADVTATLAWKNPTGLTSEEMETSQTKLKTIWQAEHVKHLRATAKNNLEAYIFWAKNEGVSDNAALTAAAGAAAVQRVIDEATAMQEWLEEGEGASDNCAASQYESRLENLRGMVAELTKQPEEATKTVTTDSADDNEGDL
ncbi:Hsp70 protein, putative [Leishmania donovani]|uniref:Hsp70 protein, putative n=1 Tax=Leishmania donovani TaxID=5661 RepID=A0A3S5H808_LEIDO|nr:Hsp70 protein, putative [Leishmania donovani]